MDINIPDDFVTQMASSTATNMSGVGLYIALLLGMLLAFYILDTLVDLVYSDHEDTSAV